MPVKICAISDTHYTATSAEGRRAARLGGDAHSPYEIGEFAPHLELLRSIGFDGDLKDIMLEDVPGTATE